MVKNAVINSLLYYISIVATTEVSITLASSISLMSLKTGLIYELQCQTNAEPDSLTFSIGSTTYNATQQLMQTFTYIRKLTVTEFAGTDITVHCNWTINGVSFIGSDIIKGKVVYVLINL